MKKIIKNIKKNIRIMINKFRNSSKKTKITFLSVITAFLLIIIFIVFYNVNTNLKADVTITESPDGNIPDVNLYKCMVDNYNGAYEENYDYTHIFTDDEFNKFYSLDCDGRGHFESFKGIEKMSNLENLYVAGEPVYDFGNNPKLKSLDICGLYESINLSNNTELEYLNLSCGNYDSLDLSNNKKLKYLSINSDNLDSLDLSNNKELTSLSLGADLKNLDLSNNNKIKELTIDYSKISTLDISNNVKLEYLSLEGNYELTNLIMQHENQEMTRLFIDNNNIESIDLTKFPNLEQLYAGNNKISTLDLSNNSRINGLYLEHNKLSSLDVSNNESLAFLNVNDNELSTLDLSNNTYLYWLDAADNKLSTIDLSNNRFLYYLQLSNNVNLDCYGVGCIPAGGIKTLDLSNNIALSFLDLSYSDIETLDLSNNENLSFLQLYMSDISSLDLSNNTNLQLLSLSFNDIETLNLNNNTKLKILDIRRNRLNKKFHNIDLSNNSELISLDLSGNEFKNLDLSNNSKINSLYLNNSFAKNINMAVGDSNNLLSLSSTTKSNFGYNPPTTVGTSNGVLGINYDGSVTANKAGTEIMQYSLPNGYYSEKKVNNKIKYTISNSTAKKDNSKNNIKKMSYIPSNSTLKKLENEQGANDTCSVTFVIDDSQVVKSIDCGSTLSDISDIPNPEKEGYRLSYWSTTEDSTGRVFEVDEINTNLVLYPIFEPEVYNVNFYNGNKLIDSVAIDYNTAVTKPETDPTKEGYIFKYWSESENGLEYDFSSVITKNKTLFAVFEAETDRLNKLSMKDDIVKTSLHMTKGILSSTMDLDNIKVLSNNTELNKYKFIKTGDKLVVGNENKDIAVIGDSNKDGNIDIGDLTRTYKIYKKTYTSSDVEKVAADSNEDDTIDIGDLTRTYKLYKKN